MKHKKKILCLAKNKPFISNIPPPLKRHPFSIEVFQDENNEDKETEMNSNTLDCNREINNDKENVGFDGKP
ncbi:hypothetical protein RF55_17533 [Lasius niger]|uniref:Uncharacterized protein n=1 Tax=Lasius niger TaxID=67767 RepID=A0A0J7K322_LASNI|nr:hypothetical protein RF55_17533 [Lasius niger]